jgi:hypothetical protein
MAPSRPCSNVVLSSSLQETRGRQSSWIRKGPNARNMTLWPRLLKHIYVSVALFLEALVLIMLSSVLHDSSTLPNGVQVFFTDFLFETKPPPRRPPSSSGSGQRHKGLDLEKRCKSIHVGMRVFQGAGIEGLEGPNQEFVARSVAGLRALQRLLWSWKRDDVFLPVYPDK